MTTNAENDLNSFGHVHEPEIVAEIIQFPTPTSMSLNTEEIVAKESEKPSKTAMAGMGAAVVYSMVLIGYPAYAAYETLEGNEVLYVHAIGGATLAGSAALGVAWAVDKFKR